MMTPLWYDPNGAAVQLNLRKIQAQASPILAASRQRGRHFVLKENGDSAEGPLASFKRPVMVLTGFRPGLRPDIRLGMLQKTPWSGYRTN